MQDSDTRAAVQVSDVLVSFFVLVAIVAVAPILYKFIGMVSASADPFSSLALQLMVPGLVIALIISVGVSARSGA